GARSSLAFFFQAEDGIRVFHVTGVQTCALPIYRDRQPLFDVAGDRRAEALPRATVLDERMAPLFPERPAEAVRVGGAIRERHRRPPCLEARGSEELARVQRGLPGGEILHREIPR